MGEIADVDISLSKDITDTDDVSTSTSLLSSQPYSRKEDVVRLRKYRIRKLRKLVDKCRIKNIRFPMYYVRISTNLAKNVDAVTDVELLDLTTECLQSLGSDFDTETESSSSDSSNEHRPISKKVKKRKGTFLTRSPPAFDKTNPYNTNWHHSYSCSERSGNFFPRTWITPQEQQDIFNQGGYYSVQGGAKLRQAESYTSPSLELYPEKNPPAHYGNRLMFKHETGLGPIMETNREFTRLSEGQGQGNPEYPLWQHQTEQETLPMDVNIGHSGQTDSFDSVVKSSQSRQSEHIPASFDVETPQLTSTPNEDEQPAIRRVCQAKGKPLTLLRLQAAARKNKNFGESSDEYSSVATDMSAREVAPEPEPMEINVSLTIFYKFEVYICNQTSLLCTSSNKKNLL